MSLPLRPAAAPSPADSDAVFRANFQKTTMYKQMKALEEEDARDQPECSICLERMPSVRSNNHTCYQCLMRYKDGPKDEQGRLLDPVTRQPMRMCKNGHPRVMMCGALCP